MSWLHEFALIFGAWICQPKPVLVRYKSLDASALKLIHKAGRRGGESIARSTHLQFDIFGVKNRCQ
ncbi:hypothetical protein EKE44_11105 [Salmonella enterica]|nr:hypothetical protein [Salmonella enterica]EAV5792842.1 hypothetical protein [Salmonella enterica]ECU8232509.1 hypothetical protein [Salmonella enterica subsp. enterica serovar Lome]EDS4832705.1 hypothetical protein [Salmonella enterica subsp. enterica serovar Lome]